MENDIQNEYCAEDDFARSIDWCYAAIRERVRNGGPPWRQKMYTIVNDNGELNIRAQIADAKEYDEFLEKLNISMEKVRATWTARYAAAQEAKSEGESK